MAENKRGTLPYYDVDYDLSNCDKEPIHIIRTVQAHACLIGADMYTLSITHVSENVSEHLGSNEGELFAKTLNEVLHHEVLELLQLAMRKNDFSYVNPIRVTEFNGKLLSSDQNLIIHLSGSTLVLEFEAYHPEISADQFLHLSDRSVQRIQSATDPERLFDITVNEIKRLTAYDRVMLYQFDHEQNGVVVAEAKEAHLEPFLHLHYPASDIPSQARKLFIRNQIRIIVDAQSDPVFILDGRPEGKRPPLDLSDSVARGVSPIHLEYLVNMGVRASMSVAVVIDGELWGLIAMHHTTPRFIDWRLRNLVRFLGKVISGHLALQQALDLRQKKLQAGMVRSRLMTQMSKNWNILDGLLHQPTNLMDLNDSNGTALMLDGELYTMGNVPPKQSIRQLIKWLEQHNEGSVFITDQLSTHWPQAAQLNDCASGLLAVRIAQTPPEYILWFKPETVRLINWGGDPRKAVQQKTGHQRLSPRRSFQQWQQKVRNKSLPWHDHDHDVAIALRNDIRDVIIRKYKELRRLNSDLKEAYEELQTFSYTVSHDLRAPLRTIEGFSQILREDYSDKLGEHGIQVLNTIASSVGKMNSFINDLLSLSTLGQKAMMRTQLDLSKEVHSAWNLLNNIPGSDTELVLRQPLPSIYADQTSMQQLLTNLLSNAVKYAKKDRKTRVEIGGEKTDNGTMFYVKDNGIGLDMRYADRIFEAFQRLVPEAEYEGTGVGLAIVKKVIHNHGGSIRVESRLGEGTTFYCFFPDSPHDESKN